MKFGTPVTGAFGALLLCLALSSNAHANCGSPANAIERENCLPGTPQSQWDISGAGDPSIQGFATDISVNVGETVSFKINTNATAYTIDIYRMGYYGGMGARLVTSIQPSATLPQVQPACVSDSATKLVDCGNWGTSASWQVPGNAVSGIYFAHLIRTDTRGDSHIVFIVRNDTSGSSILFQTSDETWQAYNGYGGASLYGPDNVFDISNRAYKVSYNRPFDTRGFGAESATWVFGAEYPMVRFLEANGYDVSYFTGIDAARFGSAILKHKLYLTVGHDEYWSGPHRANVEAARDAGVNMAFFSGNDVFWKTRLEPSIDGSNTPNRTLVCYKQTIAGTPPDPLDPPIWTGTWRDARSPEGGRPENSLTGTLFMVNGPGADNRGTLSIKVPAADGKMRFWRNTSVANLASGQTAVLPPQTLGYEWDEDIDNGARPSGTFDLSTATYTLTDDLLLDQGASYGPGAATHHMTLHRAPSGALVFGAGTVQWSWGLDSTHDDPFGTSQAPDPDMQQATANLLADMGVQPASLQSGLVAAAASGDTVSPTSTITWPTNGATVATGSAIPVSGTAKDSAGGVVGGVELSVDGGNTWHPANGRENWTYSWTPSALGSFTLKSRSTDDSANTEIPTSGVSVVTVNAADCPCSDLNASALPALIDADDANSVEVGVRLRADFPGYITGIRFYKAAANTGTHVGHLWSNTGTLLATATFTNETSSGWQQVSFNTPVAITANTTYVASYLAPAGHYSATPAAFANGGIDIPPLHFLGTNVDGANGVFTYSNGPAFPFSSFNATNYWVDVVYVPASSMPGAPPAVLVNPSSLTFAYVPGGSGPPPAQTVNVYNEGDGSLPWTASSSAPWLIASPSSGSAPSSLSVSVDPSGLAAGTYTGTVTVTPSAATTPSQTISVTLTVTNLLLFSNFADGTMQGWAFSPLGLSTNWSVANGALQYNGGGHTQVYAGDAAWKDYTLSAAVKLSTLNDFPGGIRGRIDPVSGAGYTAWMYPAEGVIKLFQNSAWNIDSGFILLGQAAVAFDTSNFHNLELSFQGNQIEVSYDGAVVITATDSTHPAGLVALDVSSQRISFTNVIASSNSPTSDSLSLDGNSLKFTAAAQSNPASQSVQLSSTGGSLAWTATADVPWLTLSPASGSTPANLQVSVSSSTLDPGSYKGTITVLSLGATNTKQVINVDLTVGAAATNTTTTLTSSLNPSSFQQAVTLTATVAPVSQTGGTPTGTVTFNDGTTVLANGIALAGGIATFQTSSLTASTHAITANYGGDSSFAPSSASLTQTVNAGTPTISWAPPANISYGTPLNATQLNASASVVGTFVYAPPAETVLGAGSNQKLSVTFTPTDAVNYAPQTASVTINVLQGAPTISWATPADISYGTLLSATQLNASASVPGAFTYSPGVGTLLSPGSQQLSATFTPTDLTNYTTQKATVNINVADRAPVAADDAYSVDENSTLNVSAASGVLVNDSGIGLSVATTTSPSHGTVTLNADGSFTYTPAAEYFGPDSFGYAATDGFLTSNVAGVNITVNFSSANQTVGAGATVTTDTADAGTSPATPVQTSVTTPVPGAVSIGETATTQPPITGFTLLGEQINITAPTASADNPLVLVFTLDASLIAQGQNENTLQVFRNGSLVAACDGTLPNGASPTPCVSNRALLATGDVQLTVRTVAASRWNFGTALGNHAPVAVDDSYSTGAGVTLTVPSPGVLTNDTDADLNTLTAIIQTPSAHGTLTLNRNGSFTYVPTAGYAGSDTFTYKANDGASDSNAATVSLTVTASTTTTTLTSSVNPSTYGQAVTLTAKVSSAAGTPTGTVTFKDAGTALGSAVTLNSSGIATYQTSTLAAGPHSLTAEYSGAGSFAPGSGSLTQTVNTAALKVTADDQTRAYGASNPTFTVTYAGFVNGETASALGGTLGVATAATSTSPAGTYAITPSGLTSSSYTINFVPGTLTVTAAAPTITWNPPAAITYGTALTLTQLNASSGIAGTFAYTPAVGTVLNAGNNQTLSVTFTPTDKVNYQTQTSSVSINVTPAPLTVAAQDASRAYAAANPAFTVSYAGFVNNESATALGGTLSVTTTATATSPVGSYPITPAGLTSTNYAIKFVPGNLNITAAAATITWNNPAAIPYGTPLSPTQLNASTSVPGTFAYTPSAGTRLTAGNNQTLSVTFTPTDKANYQTLTSTVKINVTPAPLTVTAQNATRIYGTANPTFTVNYGGFVNNESAAVLGGTLSLTTLATTTSPVGTYAITPSGLTSNNYAITFVPGSLAVTAANPIINWNNPAAISYGTPLSSTQLNASSTVAGTLTYSPPAGTVLNAGNNQTLLVTLVPADNANYSTTTKTVTINVGQAASMITWANPADIVTGTPLGDTQLNATATVNGSFVYSPPAGTVLNPGSGQTLSVTFTPSDTLDYAPVSVTVSINILNTATGTDVATQAGDAAITFSDVTAPGMTSSKLINPSTAGTLPDNSYLLDSTLAYDLTTTATFSGPVQVCFTDSSVTDPSDFATLRVLHNENGVLVDRTILDPDSPAPDFSKKTLCARVSSFSPVAIARVKDVTPPSIAIAAPTATTYTLNQTVAASYSCTDSGSGVDSCKGTVDNGSNIDTSSAGQKAFTVTTTDKTRNTATQSVSYTVGKGAPTITWGNPADIVYGTGLSATQLNATSNVPGTFAYSPASGTVLKAGAQTLTVTLTPNDTANYSTATQSVTINVTKGTPVLTWANPADVTAGTALSSTQLNATANVPGSFAYTPPSGSVLNAGIGQTLSTLFTPTDTADYNTATKSVQINVKASTSVSAPTSSLNPSTYGQAVTFTATVTSTAGTPTGSLQFFDGTTLLGTAPLSNGSGSITTSAVNAGTRSITAVYSANGNFAGSTSAALTQTVNKASATATFTFTPTSQQYSDQATFKATLAPVNGASPATSAQFKVASQIMGSQNFIFNSTTGLYEASLTVPLLETSATSQLSPGSKQVTASFTSTNYSILNRTGSLGIRAEDARTYYAGQSTYPTNPAASTATIPLQWTIKDITAVGPSDAAYDPYAGDITLASVTFVNRTTGATIATVPVTPTTSDQTVGTASYNWAVDIGTATSQTYTVGVIVSGHYTRNNTTENTTITVNKQ